MIDKWMTAIPPLTGDEERAVYVYVPDIAARKKSLRFPVLYMFDGHNVFFDEDATYGKSWGMKTYADKQRLQMIIVAVECNHHPNNGRLSEYSPFSFRDARIGSVQGRGEITMEWMIHTLKPLIDSRYPTLPERESTFIAGSSMGGLMSLYAVIKHNDVFSRAACLSPSLWTQPKRMLSLIRTQDVTPDTIIYMDYGEKELRNHEGMRACYTDAMKALMDKGVMLTSRIVPGGEHCEASWEKQLPIFMPLLTHKK